MIPDNEVVFLGIVPLFLSGEAAMKAPFVIGRALLGGFFLYSGINHFGQAGALAAYARAKHVPAAKAGVIASGVMLTVGGASLLLGIKPKLGAAATVGFLAGVSPIMHDFWNMEDPQQRQNEMINFSKNMALAGAALALAGVEEPWPVSLSTEKPSRIDRIRRATREFIAA
jgi:putative oxidoreductase